MNNGLENGGDSGLGTGEGSDGEFELVVDRS
jgi:hypothetical protein